jgi:hypothetical protein
MENYIIFLVFILANSYFMYKVGENAGKFSGMISITQFFKQKNVLKDKNSILGFNNWPEPVKILYEAPDPELFKD